jgi:hypothetical protein
MRSTINSFFLQIFISHFIYVYVYTDVVLGRLIVLYKRYIRIVLIG